MHSSGSSMPSAVPSGQYCTPQEPLPFLSPASRKNRIGFYDPVDPDWGEGRPFVHCTLGFALAVSSSIRFRRAGREPASRRPTASAV